MQKIILTGSLDSDLMHSLDAPAGEVKPGYLPIKNLKGKVTTLTYGIWDVILDKSRIAELKSAGNKDMVVGDIFEIKKPHIVEGLKMDIEKFYDNFSEDISDFQKKTIENAPLDVDIMTDPVVKTDGNGEKSVSFFLMFKDNYQKRYCLEITILKSKIINSLNW